MLSPRGSGSTTSELHSSEGEQLAAQVFETENTGELKAKELKSLKKLLVQKYRNSETEIIAFFKEIIKKAINPTVETADVKTVTSSVRSQITQASASLDWPKIKDQIGNGIKTANEKFLLSTQESIKEKEEAEKQAKLREEETENRRNAELKTEEISKQLQAAEQKEAEAALRDEAAKLKIEELERKIAELELLNPASPNVDVNKNTGSTSPRSSSSTWAYDTLRATMSSMGQSTDVDTNNNLLIDLNGSQGSNSNPENFGSQGNKKRKLSK